ncbi:MAG TPA: AI-2E family transporter [Candidatus Saccharimonadales bacterium]|nr:AI-2E family transporter [Candidatus Saccharimonadales bacterium]
MFGFRRTDSKDGNATVTVDVPNRTILRVIGSVVATVILIAAVRQASHALLLIFTAFFLALALNAPVHWLAQRLPGKRKGNRSIATAISFLFIVLILGGFIASIVPPLVKQTNTFVRAIPGIIEDSKDEDSEIGSFIRKYNLESEVQNFSDELGDRLKASTGTAVKAVSTVGSSAFTVLTVLVLTIMMLVEGPRWLRLFKDIIPDQHHERAERLAFNMYKVVKGYVNGQVILAALAAALIFPVMLILDISYPVALMGVVFICGLIPMVGHTIGAVFVTVVALFTSPVAALIILGYYFLYQQIENVLIQPRIQANSTNMSPLLVFISVVIGVNFGGIFGGLVAIPVAGCIRIVVLDYLHRKKIIEPDTHELADTTPSHKPKKPKAKAA